MYYPERSVIMKDNEFKRTCDNCTYCLHENGKRICKHPIRGQRNAEVTKDYSCGHWVDVFDDFDWSYD